MTELVAFVALNPGASKHAVDEAMWPGARVTNATRTTTISRTRNWLGKTDDEEPYLSMYDVATGYRLHHDVTVDWDDFQRLARRGLAAGPSGVEDLVAALNLVRGQPFSGIDPRDYTWAELHIQDIVSAISDTAQAVVDLADRHGNPALTLDAAVRGLAADPTHEHLLESALAAATALGLDEQEARLHERLRRMRAADQ
jgi:hypothetical protein